MAASASYSNTLIQLLLFDVTLLGLLLAGVLCLDLELRFVNWRRYPTDIVLLRLQLLFLISFIVGSKVSEFGLTGCGIVLMMFVLTVNLLILGCPVV